MNHPFHSNNKDPNAGRNGSRTPQHDDESALTACLNWRKVYKHRRTVSLSDFPSANRFRWATSSRTRPPPESIAQELDTLQNLFYADKRYKLLVILQGTDPHRARTAPSGACLAA